jgi:predicted nucleotide-binding protein
MARQAKKPPTETGDLTHKRVYLKQSDVPATSLEDALRVSNAILEHYAGKPTSPLYVAKALNIDPQGRQLKLLTGASIAFGLTEGGAQAEAISVTDSARQILRPREEGADVSARREAMLKPRVFGEFLHTYDGHPVPRNDIAVNVLEGMGVPRDKAEEVFDLIVSSAQSVGYVEQIKDKLYVSLSPTGASAAVIAAVEPPPATPDDPSPTEQQPPAPPPAATLPVAPSARPQSGTELGKAIVDDERRRRVFITHGKNRELVEPIRQLLEYGELEAITSVERQSVSKPVPEKVMDDMRSCGAAIIHVDADKRIVDAAGDEHVVLNPNVLIEIGAAMAFYGRRFILLVKEGVKLPSNLQGLYEVRYNGDTLDAQSTIKLLEAIKDIKNYQLPADSEAGDS